MKTPTCATAPGMDSCKAALAKLEKLVPVVIDSVIGYLKDRTCHRTTLEQQTALPSKQNGLRQKGGHA